MEEEGVTRILPDLLALQMKVGTIAKEYEQPIEAGNGMKPPAGMLSCWPLDFSHR